jgi:uncharacterized protein YdaU (DUF1376 family)
MAKDPAFLFYTGDWLQGTMGMSFEEKGAYLELLVFQFNVGKFSLAQAKQVLSICSASVFEKVIQKFDTDGTFFWKQRLTDEIERRKKFSESRRNNAKSLKKTTLDTKKSGEAYAKHMETETETITETEILTEYENWTKQIIEGNDQYFEQMFMKEAIPQSPNIQFWIMDHRDLLNRYPKMRPPNQNAFRKSCIKHIRENYKKEPNGKLNSKQQKSASTSDYLKQYYSGRANGEQV